MGISQISTEFANFSGTFQLPPADQLGWTQEIGVEWRKKESIDENYQKVLEKMERGEKLNDKDVKALQAYAERYPQRDLPDNVRDALEKAGKKQAKKVEGKVNNWGVWNENIEGVGSIINPIQTELWGNKIGVGTSDIYSYTQYGKSIFRKWGNNSESFFNGTVFSRGGAQISDVMVLGKIVKNDSKLGKLVSKLPSYEHSSINRDLKMMRENTKSFSAMSKIGKAFKIAGWVGTALDVSASLTELKSQGFSNEQTAAITARRTAVDLASSTVGANVGRLAGAAIGQAIIPIPGLGGAIGALAGSVVGGTIGSWVGSAINKQLDSSIKPRKEGWSWPW